LKKIPQKDRHLAIASGDVQCAATTVETWVVWNASGVATKQIFQMDKSYGADGMAVRNNIGRIADLKGKTVAASAPGTAPYFTLAWFLKKNGLSVKDVSVVNLEPGPAAQAFVAGQNDAAMTYEPYLSTVRANPQAGKIIATTLDYPMIMDTFGCTPKFLADNPKAARAHQERSEEELRDHGRRREADRRGFRVLGEIPALAGQGRQPEILRRRACAIQQGGRRPPARDRHPEVHARHDRARRHALHQVTAAKPRSSPRKRGSSGVVTMSSPRKRGSSGVVTMSSPRKRGSSDVAKTLGSCLRRNDRHP
jgi:hypothetical protein